jgi:DNA-binding beta-propeller fold protein YncE
VPLPLDGLGPLTREVLLAGDGQRYAAAAYPAGIAGPAAPPCRLAVIDFITGAVVRTQVVCTARDTLFSLALEGGAAGPVTYVGLWRAPEDVDGRRADGNGVLVAIDAATGAVAGRTSLGGVPEDLLLAAAPGQAGLRLYCVEGTPGPEARDPGVPGLEAGRWQLVGLNPVTLEVESTLPLDEAPAEVAVAPDGDGAYVRLAGQRTVVHLDLRTGQSRPLITLPGQSAGGLAVTGDRLYVTRSLGGEVWAVDRRSGRLARTTPVGRHPMGITLAHR